MHHARTAIESRRVFVAGASGVIGRRLIPLLVRAGHDVTGTTRSADAALRLRGSGASPVIVDVFDAQALLAAVVAARPDVVIHQLTDLSGSGVAPSDERVARTARIRREGTANLIAAAVAAGTARVIAQSLALLYAPGPEPHDETHPLAASEPWMTRALPGVLELEHRVTTDARFDGLVLRYGLLYGPGAATAEPADPSPVHVDAAAWAAALAVDRGAPGVFNIVDDDGPVANAKVRAELGWSPGFRLPSS
jgi:nucleoside-diphosphate-sugar epimerase